MAKQRINPRLLVKAIADIPTVKLALALPSVTKRFYCCDPLRSKFLIKPPPLHSVRELWCPHSSGLTL